MKSLTIIPFLLAALLLAVVNRVCANDERYLATMKKTIQSIYDANTIEALQASVNTLERIAQVEKSKWEPHYYSGFAYILMATREKDTQKKDQWLDLALKAVENASQIAPEEAEVVALEGFAHMIRVTVDPASRGPQYGPLSVQTFSRALAMQENNPRALALLAQMQFGTAQFFGSPTTEPCAQAAKAREYFDTFTSSNPLAPVWGKKMNDELLSKCP